MTSKHRLAPPRRQPRAADHEGERAGGRARRRRPRPAHRATAGRRPRPAPPRARLATSMVEQSTISAPFAIAGTIRRNTRAGSSGGQHGDDHVAAARRPPPARGGRRRRPRPRRRHEVEARAPRGRPWRDCAAIGAPILPSPMKPICMAWSSSPRQTQIRRRRAARASHRPAPGVIAVVAVPPGRHRGPCRRSRRGCLREVAATRQREAKRYSRVSASSMRVKARAPRMSAGAGNRERRMLARGVGARRRCAAVASAREPGERRQRGRAPNKTSSISRRCAAEPAAGTGGVASIAIRGSPVRPEQRPGRPVGIRARTGRRSRHGSHRRRRTARR